MAIVEARRATLVEAARLCRILITPLNSMTIEHLCVDSRIHGLGENESCREACFVQHARYRDDPSEGGCYVMVHLALQQFHRPRAAASICISVLPPSARPGGIGNPGRVLTAHQLHVQLRRGGQRRGTRWFHAATLPRTRESCNFRSTPGDSVMTFWT